MRNQKILNRLKDMKQESEKLGKNCIDLTMRRSILDDSQGYDVITIWFPRNSEFGRRDYKILCESDKEELILNLKTIEEVSEWINTNY